ncbi:Cof-type HAD-IIB family hydrolase [Robertkochia sediminum]|uniref:Cof-type HAD-IIB family hydrolase n=1 Tax=Robertkochia sediminum TaxID=2785326 RepID=UPI0019344450|nr:Cof-type HAD-IIB family hydrolase [Robertkochia sediminum]MBL7472746.1 HAD family phosphatase [Robertkochia sediminum]
MKYKIIFTDIDGTLLDSNRTISDYTAAQIKKIKSHLPFILVSSRMPRQMTYFQEQLEDLGQSMIAYNGALVLHGDQPIHSTEIVAEHTQALIDFNQAQDQPVHLSLYHGDEWTVEAMDYWAKREENNTRVTPEVRSNRETLASWRSKGIGAHKIMCMGEVSQIDKIYSYMEAHFGTDLHLYRSKDTYIEIANKRVSKLTGINMLLDAMGEGITLDQAVAFGDNYNDIEMLNAVGLGVAVANAREELKAVANTITGHHKEDGVGRFLEEFSREL